MYFTFHISTILLVLLLEFIFTVVFMCDLFSQSKAGDDC